MRGANDFGQGLDFNNFSLFQFEEKTSFYKKYLPCMVSIHSGMTSGPNRPITYSFFNLSELISLSSIRV